MRRAARRLGRVLLLVLATGGLPAAFGQARPDTLKNPAPTFVADTARRVVVAAAPPEPPTAVTPRRGLRIGTAVVVLTLTTLLLYNVRSR